MKKFIFICVMLVVSSASVAGGSYEGKIQPFFYSDTLYLVPVDAEVTNRPGCASRSYLGLPNGTDHPAFKSKYSLILAYWVAGKALSVGGTGECTNEGDEIIRWIKAK
ncbi:MAG: hypothetical protein MK096_15045 [Oleiphilaceae bacterium]|nr:hypothetical protein [Oleiphilaceae bacterium]